VRGGEPRLVPAGDESQGRVAWADPGCVQAGLDDVTERPRVAGPGNLGCLRPGRGVDLAFPFRPQGCPRRIGLPGQS
jgi:hypothetical protein